MVAMVRAVMRAAYIQFGLADIKPTGWNETCGVKWLTFAYEEARILA